MKLQLFAVVVAFGISGCTQEPDSRAGAAAVVNGNPIPIDQFRQELAQLDRATAPASAPAQVLDGMINRALLAREAERLELDRSGPVSAAIAAARASILAQAYVEHAVGAGYADVHEIRTFYHANPALFAKRRVYRLFELAVIAPPNAPDEWVRPLQERTARSKHLHEVAQWLKSQQLAFNTGGVTKPAEQLSTSLLQRVSAMREGELAVLEVQGGASVIQLVGTEEAPISQEDASAVIERLMRARRRLEVAQREVKYLRDQAAIEYLLDLPPAVNAGESGAAKTHAHDTVRR